MRPTVVLAICVMALVGCDPEPDPDPEPPAPATHQFLVTDCTDPDYSVPLSVTTDVEDELAYLEEVVACAGQSGGVWLQNNSAAVWTVTVDEVSPNIDYGVSRAGVFTAALRRADVLVPGQNVSFPDATPDALEWHADFPLSVAWVGQEALLDRVQSVVADAVQSALDKRTPTGAAAYACTSAVAQLASAENDPADPFKPLSDAFGLVAQGSECVQRLSQITVVEADGREVRLSDSMAQLAAGHADDFGRAEKAVTFASAASRVARFVLKLV